MAAKVWEDIKKGVEDSITFATEKTKEFTAISKLKLAISGLKRKTDGKFKELGKYVYGKTTEGKVSELEKDESVKELITDINSLKDELKTKEQALEEVGKKDVKVEEVIVAEEDVTKS
ncbi:hypothetical protein IIC38_00595 [candidate division KSB1 bacterium]|nr:hypothetical protein [candidate division KSB1 bacterium]